MIYQDVTSACESSFSSGVQRIARGLYRELSRSNSVFPITWGYHCFCSLSGLEMRHLTEPFGRRTKGAQIQRNYLRFLTSKVSTEFSRSLNRVDLEKRMKPKDLLFMADIYSGPRTAMVSKFLVSNPHIRSVALFYDAIPWLYPELTRGVNTDFFVSYVRSLIHFKKIIAISEESADQLRECWRQVYANALHSGDLKFEETRWPAIHVVGLPCEELNPRSAENGADHRSAQTQDQSMPTVLCVGIWEPRKNQGVLLKAAELLWKKGCRFRLLLIGGSVYEYGKDIRILATELIEQGYPLEVREQVDNSALEQAFHDCLFTVFPSILEGFGLPILESLINGRPCICASNGAIGEVSSGGGCLHVNTKSPQDVANGMERLLSSTELLEELRKQATHRHIKTWSEYMGEMAPLLAE